MQNLRNIASNRVIIGNLGCASHVYENFTVLEGHRDIDIERNRAIWKNKIDLKREKEIEIY